MLSLPARDPPRDTGSGTLTDIGGGFQGVVTPVNHAGGVVCSMRAARSAGEPEVAPELVIIAAGAVNCPSSPGCLMDE